MDAAALGARNQAEKWLFDGFKALLAGRAMTPPSDAWQRLEKSNTTAAGHLRSALERLPGDPDLAARLAAEAEAASAKADWPSALHLARCIKLYPELLRAEAGHREDLAMLRAELGAELVGSVANFQRACGKAC